MRHEMHRTQPAVGLAALLLLAACTATDSVGLVTEPGVEPPAPQATRLQLDFSNIEVIADCDGIEGDGEFKFSVVVRPSFASAITIYNASRTMGDGDRTPALGRRTLSAVSSPGQQVTVEFRASEVDHSIFTGEYNDSRMDNLLGTSIHLYNGSTWSNQGPRSITLGSGSCQVRLNYIANVVQ